MLPVEDFVKLLRSPILIGFVPVGYAVLCRKDDLYYIMRHGHARDEDWGAMPPAADYKSVDEAYLCSQLGPSWCMMLRRWRTSGAHPGMGLDPGVAERYIIKMENSK